MPKLSFVVPVYNTAPYLRRCLDSLLSQSQFEFEIIAVDDGSSDDSPIILNEYCQKHPDLIYVFSKENGGLSDARNFGLKHARSEFVAFVDSDDYLHPDFLALTVQKMEAESLDLLLFDYFFAYENKCVPAKLLPLANDGDPISFLTAAPMAWCRVYRKSLLGIDPFRKGIYYEDLEMTPRMLLAAKNIAYLPSPLYYYYQREGSIMRESDFSMRWLDIFTVTESVYRHFEEKGKVKAYQNELEYLFIEHLLRSAALRFSRFQRGRALFSDLMESVEKHFPNWKKNPYLARASFFFRLVVFFSSKGCGKAVSLLSKLKGML